MTTPQIIKNNELNDIGCLVVTNEKISSSIVINDEFLNEEEEEDKDAIGVEKVEKVENLQALILPQNPIQNKIIPVSTPFKFLQAPKNKKKQLILLR